MSKESIQKIQNTIDGKINKVADEMEQNNEQVRQHVSNIEQLVSVSNLASLIS